MAQSSGDPVNHSQRQAAPERVRPRTPQAVVPLSFAQERLWFLQQWEPADPAYNITRVYRLRGALDRAVLARSIEVIAQRHEVLRSVFDSIGDQPVQRVLPAAAVKLEVIDLRTLPQRARAAEAARRASAAARQPFDLAAGLLFRPTLYQLGADDHVFALAVHQSVFDGRSLDIFFRELEALYLAGGKVAGANLPDLPVQYADYAIWQRERQSGTASAEQLGYWKKLLDGASLVLELPTDRPRTADGRFSGARRRIVVEPRLSEALRELGRQSATTLFVTLMAAYNILLHRYTGEKDIIVGFPVSQRDWPELENLIGSFVNTLPLRADLSGAITFRDLLAQLKQRVHEALKQRDVPFERLVQEITQRRDFERAPLFQTMFTFQNRLAAELAIPGTRSQPIDCDSGGAKFDLTLALGERDGRLWGSFEYRTGLFDAATIERLAGHYVSLLRSIAADPDRSIGRLSLLTRAERKQILITWNQTAAKFADKFCIHQLFEAQAKKNPAAIAVQSGRQSLTYGDLHRRANRLARYLKGVGAGPEKLVGVCLERSLDMVIGLLGVLKAGAAYVPLDPEYPRERVHFMLQDCKIQIVVTQRRLLARLGFAKLRRQSSANMKVVCVDGQRKRIAQQSARSLSSGVRTRNLAYVIYTSGSTGQPKGVAIEHTNAVAFLSWAKTVFRASELSGVLASTSICFDLSVFEIFAPLSWGGKLILVENALDLSVLPASAQVTLLNTVPSAAAELLAAGGLPASVKTVNLAGERLTSELVRNVYANGAVEKVYDLYGPSETTTYSTFALRDGAARATIGRPIANTKIYLLDEKLEPVPVGIAGELYIGGAGVARGYLNRPELTREKFVANPFAGKPGERLYRTGDRARYLADGNIEYLGRTDNQVKIRGHRIELGEVETALGRHPMIEQCAVTAPVITADSKFQIANCKLPIAAAPHQLVAYVVAKQGHLPEARDLKNFLRKNVPEFMVPARFVSVAQMPLTPSGKIDRQALPLPDPERQSGRAELAAPRDETEARVAQVWREILQLESVGTNENFFELGGHSLLAARVVWRLRESLHVELGLRKIFELPTVAELAAHIDALRRAENGLTETPIQTVPRGGNLPLSSAQQRLWFLHGLDPQSSAYNIPAAYRIAGRLDIAALKDALTIIIERHESLRTSIIEADGRPAARILERASVKLRLMDLSALAPTTRETNVMRAVQDSAREPFDLNQAPLMRAQLLRLGSDAHVLILNFHHIIADGSSLVNFYRELALAYEALADGRTVKLEPLRLQYADYASWQQHWLDGAAARSQIGYWRRRLKGVAPLDLPADCERPSRQSYRGARVTRRISADLTGALKQLSQSSGVTLFMTLLAGFNILLARLSGREDVVVGSTIAGRNRPELDGLIGFFINALALRCDLSGSPSFVELLKRVREMCLDAFAHQEVPFDKVVEALKPERDVSRNPLFQVVFNLNDLGVRDLKLNNCQCEKIVQPEPAAKFDLVLYAPERDGAIELTFVYNADLFAETRVAAWLEQLHSILVQGTAAPDTPVDQYSLVTSLSRAVLPDPAIPLGAHWYGPVHEWMARHACLAPERPALADDEGHWTYGQLNEQSDRLANLLVEAGIQRGDVVAVYAERRAVLAIALFGVLKAGAVFMIVDPAYPTARQLDYLRIGRPSGWLQLDPAAKLPAELYEFLAPIESRRRVTLPSQSANLAKLLDRYDKKTPQLALSADDPAYIAFTSGSTGQPKGVLCRHGPMTHFLPWQEETFALLSSDRYCLLSGLGYNHLQREIFTALTSGAQLYVPSAAQMRSPGELLKWMREKEITVLHLTPALGRLLRSSDHTMLPAPRRIFFGGDLLTGEDVTAMRALAPNSQIVSFYGATESQRAVGYFSVEEESLRDLRSSKPLATGKGARDVQLLLLTKSGQMAGIGELGELYVRSPHLAAGYLDDDALTAANFLVNSFTQDPRDRLYRTGDRGRYRLDGSVEWAGRADRRVSIRGFRVELAEVEAVLMQQRAVRQAAVVIDNGKLKIENEKFAERLIAYVVADAARENLTVELRAFLAARLPHYMVPTHFVLLERLPLSPNGKVDYDSLPVPSEAISQQILFEEPASDLERRLAEIFIEVLGAERIGRRDDFFELGGHSLLAAQAAGRIRQRLNVSMELSSFLEAPTVAGLALRLESFYGSLSEGSTPRMVDREEIEL